MMNNVVLWGVSVSPYVRKVMVALAEKEIGYEHKEILPRILLEATGQEVAAEFNQVSPLGKIPALQIDNYSISDSAVIASYLDRKFSTGNKLYPNHPEEYGKALYFERYSDTILTNVIYQKIFLECVVKAKVLNQSPNYDLVNTAIENELPILLHYLNAQLQGKKWFSGENFSMADVAIATQLLALEMSGFNFLQKKYKNLRSHMRETMMRKSFIKISI